MSQTSNSQLLPTKSMVASNHSIPLHMPSMTLCATSVHPPHTLCIPSVCAPSNYYISLSMHLAIILYSPRDHSIPLHAPSNHSMSPFMHLPTILYPSMHPSHTQQPLYVPTGHLETILYPYAHPPHTFCVSSWFLIGKQFLPQPILLLGQWSLINNKS